MIRIILNNLIFTISTFTQIPLFKVEYKKENTKYVYLLLPIVGIIVGAISYSIVFLLDKVIVESLIIGILLIVVNILITGGIHFDGLLDSLDAFKSYRKKEEKLRIIKDPCVGAFALIYAIVIILLYIVSFYYIVENSYLKIFFIAPIISRMLLMVLINFSSLEKNDMLDLLWDKSLKKYYIVFIIIYIAIILIIYPNLLAVGLILISLLYLIYYKKYYQKHFDNLNGDLCGYFIVTTELLIFISVVLYSFLI